MPCLHCGAAAPLRSEDGAGLQYLRQLAHQRASALEQWDKKAEDLGRSFGSFEMFGAVFLWLIIGGTLLGLALGDLHDVRSLVDLDAPSSHEVAFARRLVVLVCSALALSALCATAARWYGRQQVLCAVALPPINEGAPPRCRRCGAALPKGGPVRRCGHCQADSLVDDTLLKAQGKSVKDELSFMRETAGRSLRDRETLAVRLRNALFVPPFLLLVTFPVLWFVDADPHPLGTAAAIIGAPLCILVFLLAPRPPPLTRKAARSK